MRKWLVIFPLFVSLLFGVTFSGSWFGAESLAAQETLTYYLEIATRDIRGDFTMTYKLEDSVKIRYSLSNDSSIGFFNMTLVDSADGSTVSGNKYFNGNDVIAPYKQQKWEVINYGDDASYIKWFMKDVKTD